MFYIKKEDPITGIKTFNTPLATFVKIDNMWEKVKGVYVNTLEREKYRLQNEEAKYARNKRGISDKLKALLQVEEKTPEMLIEIDRLKKMIEIINTTMVDLNKNHNSINNANYFNTKIIPGEILIQKLKNVSNFSSSFKVIKFHPFGKLLERPRNYFNNENTDGNLDNIYYRIIDTSIMEPTEISDLIVNLQARFGSNVDISVKTIADCILELNKSVFAHEAAFQEQLKTINKQVDTIVENIPKVVEYINTYPDMDQTVSENINEDNNIQLGKYLSDSQGVSTLKDIEVDNPKLVTFKTQLETKTQIADKIVDLNNRIGTNIGKNNLAEAYNLSVTKLNLKTYDSDGNVTSDTGIIDTFKNNNNKDLFGDYGFERKDETTLIDCSEDESISVKASNLIEQGE